ncbi:MAG: KEOPS complex kinase/ATPase Bud32 [Candidatus Pacearchaeota archaeon]
MGLKLIQIGAEAKIYLDRDKIIKDRIKKLYRLKELDESLRKKRTKHEKKLLQRASEIINVPKLSENKDLFKIKLEYIVGKKLSENLENLKNQKEILRQIGEAIAKLHNSGIIHGDLTTSNMIFDEQNKKLWFIDFGLGFFSEKTEDKAVDLHVLKEALESKHYRNYNDYWKEIERSYNKISKNPKEIFERLKKVEARGRYKEKY